MVGHSIRREGRLPPSTVGLWHESDAASPGSEGGIHPPVKVGGVVRKAVFRLHDDEKSTAYIAWKLGHAS